MIPKMIANLALVAAANVNALPTGRGKSSGNKMAAARGDGPPARRLHAEIKPYPEYSGELDLAATTASVDVSWTEEGGLRFEYDVSLGDMTATAAGIHIHSGTSCDKAAWVGGHYWNATAIADDMWTASAGATYTTDDQGDAVGEYVLPLGNGYDYDFNLGHTVVMHADGGARIGCGLLKAHGRRRARGSKLEATMGTYPGYAESLTGGESPIEVTGKVSARFLGNGMIKLNYRLEGLNYGDSPSGIHIHSGTSCDAPELVGGHYWNSALLGEDGCATSGTTPCYTTESGADGDPWTTTWESNSEGRAVGSFEIYTGQTYADNKDHTLVIHSGAYKVACGVLEGGSRSRGKSGATKGRDKAPPADEASEEDAADEGAIVSQ